MVLTIKQIRRIARWTKQAAQPAKIARSVLYHCYYYKIANRFVRGLHIGSGGLRIDGFMNIDADAAINADLIGGSEQLKFANESVEKIYASHLFEHIPQARALTVLREWHRVLSNNGNLLLCVPDLEALASLYVDEIRNYSSIIGSSKLDLITRVIYGGQSDRFDFHYCGYSLPTLKALLESVGFTDVQLFDRSKLSFAPFNDCGFAKIEDTLVSLNVIATKKIDH